MKTPHVPSIALLTLCLLAGSGVAAAPLGYVPLADANEVLVVDPRTRTLVDAHPVPGTPLEVLVHPTSRDLYVALEAEAETPIAVVDSRSGALLGTAGVAGPFVDWVWHPAGHTLYVLTADHLAALDVATGSVRDDVELNDIGDAFGQIWGGLSMAIDQSGGRLFLGVHTKGPGIDEESARIVEHDAVTLTLTTMATDAFYATDIEPAPDGTRLYALGIEEDEFFEFNDCFDWWFCTTAVVEYAIAGAPTRTGDLYRRWSADPLELAVHPSGIAVYALVSIVGWDEIYGPWFDHSELVVMNAASRSVALTRAIDSFASTFAVHPTRDELYVSTPRSSSIQVFTAYTYVQIASILGYGTPGKTAFAPPGLGGVIRGMDVDSVLCENLTTGAAAWFDAELGEEFDCMDGDVAFDPGDRISIRIDGEGE